MARASESGVDSKLKLSIQQTIAILISVQIMMAHIDRDCPPHGPHSVDIMYLRRICLALFTLLACYFLANLRKLKYFKCFFN